MAKIKGWKKILNKPHAEVYKSEYTTRDDYYRLISVSDVGSFKEFKWVIGSAFIKRGRKTGLVNHKIIHRAKTKESARRFALDYMKKHQK